MKWPSSWVGVTMQSPASRIVEVDIQEALRHARTGGLMNFILPFFHAQLPLSRAPRPGGRHAASGPSPERRHGGRHERTATRSVGDSAPRRCWALSPTTSGRSIGIASWRSRCCSVATPMCVWFGTSCQACGGTGGGRRSRRVMGDRTGLRSRRDRRPRACAPAEQRSQRRCRAY